jgi:cytochrome P450
MSCPITMRALENADPFPAYETLRQQGPVVWDDSLKGWLVLDAELCRHVELNEPALFRNMYADADPLIVELKGGLANITVSQGEQHQRMRRFHRSHARARAGEGWPGRSGGRFRR